MSTSSSSAGCGCGCLGAIIGIVLALIVLSICLIAEASVGVTAGLTILTFALVFGFLFIAGVVIDIFSN
ncbi:MAG: hypothetical protein WAV56_04365 [Microgenomates group bacterium]